jgi:hypothetical protein
MIVYVDPYSMFKSMTQDYPGVEIDIGGAGDYMAKVDTKICRRNEMYRAVKNSLAWEFLGSYVQDLVAYVVGHINIQHTAALSEHVVPRAAFTGIPAYYHKDLKLAFSDYIEAYESTDNTSWPCTLACIALYTVNNAAGLWLVFQIDT